MNTIAGIEYRCFEASDTPQVTALWTIVFPDDPPHNEPAKVIGAKLAVDDRLFFVAVDRGGVVGTIMAGYDGHRGWLYSVAVSPAHSGKGIGRGLVNHALTALKGLGCVKVNLQVRATNRCVVAFYEALGFTIEQRVSMGKLLT